jgi:hypothetical protein
MAGCASDLDRLRQVRPHPLAAGVARHVDFVPGDLPKYGALGAFGIRGPGPRIVDLAMLPTDASYQFARGEIYNLEASRVLREGGGLSGAHSDMPVRRSLTPCGRPRCLDPPRVPGKNSIYLSCLNLPRPLHR